VSWDIVAKRRWDRQRKLLPNLRLRYPNDTEVQELARLANVGDLTSFGQHIRSIILDAHLNNAAFKNLSTSGVRNTLNSVVRRARHLESSLRAMDVGRKGSAAHAGLLLELELSKVQPNDGKMLLPEYMGFLRALAEAGEKAAASFKSKRGPKPLTATSAFDLFVESLLMAAWQQRGDWTVYRSADGTWTGTILDAITILKKYLPQQFFPNAGRSVEYIRKKLRDHIAKNTS
jgi:hypothetical protein